jgi:hypothetical protein
MTNAPTPAPTVNPCANLLLDDVRLSRLAMELAREMSPFDQVLASFGITREMYVENIANSVQFQRYYSEHKAIWNSETGVDSRIEAKAKAIVEDFLPKADDILHNDQVALGGRISLFKEITRLAGYTEEGVAFGRQGGPAPAARVIINFGNAAQILQPVKVTEAIDAKAEEVTPAGNLPPPPPPQPQFNVPLPPVGPTGAIVRPAAPQPTGDNKPSPGQERFGASPTIHNWVK